MSTRESMAKRLSARGIDWEPEDSASLLRLFHIFLDRIEALEAEVRQLKGRET